MGCPIVKKKWLYNCFKNQGTLSLDLCETQRWSVHQLIIFDHMVERRESRRMPRLRQTPGDEHQPRFPTLGLKQCQCNSVLRPTESTCCGLDFFERSSHGHAALRARIYFCTCLRFRPQAPMIASACGCNLLQTVKSGPMSTCSSTLNTCNGTLSDQFSALRVLLQL